jgi:hypothetical protein
MSTLYALTRDVSGAVSSALDFTDDFTQISFTAGSTATVSVTVPSQYSQYIMQAEAYPTEAYGDGINGLVVSIDYYPRASQEIKTGTTIINGKPVFKKVAGGSQLKVSLPRNDAAPAIDPACEVCFYFYNV